MKLVLMIGTLGGGGAERQLALLARALGERGHEVTVATLFPGGVHAEALAQATSETGGVPGLRLLPLCRRRAGLPLRLLQRPLAAWRLRRFLRRERPDVIYSFLPVPNLLAGLAAAGLPVRRVWGVRASNFRAEPAERLAMAWGARLSRRVDALVANSRAGLDHHRRLGFGGRRQVVIPNGIDTRLFRRDAATEAAGRRLREAWGVDPGEPLVGLVARLHPMKDHAGFLAAAAEVCATGGGPPPRFVLVGEGPPEARRRLEAQAATLGLTARLVWAGEQPDMPAVYAALTVAVVSSAYGEGFPNTLGEALACRVPCVTTDVGDAAHVVGPAGLVVPPRRPDLLAGAIRQLLAEEETARRARQEAGLRRVVEHFSVDAAVRATERLLAEVASGG